jgi:hypothetical protein
MSTFVLTAVLDVMSLRDGSRRAALRFEDAESDAAFDLPISEEQLEYVVEHVAVSQMDGPPGGGAPERSPTSPPTPSSQALHQRGAVDEESIEHEEGMDPDMEADEPPLVLRTHGVSRVAPFGQHDDEDEL